MRATRQKQRRAGFTLLELLTVVAFVSITAALAAPAIMSSVANRRAGEAAHSVVRLGAFARAEAIAYGRAHVMTYTTRSTGVGGDYGTLEIWRGRSDRCSSNQWGTIITGTCASNPDCIQSLDMGSYAFPTNRVRLILDGAAAGSLCFQPNGDSFYAPAGGLWGMTPPAGGDAVSFIIRRESNGTATGTDRFVVFPFGATPRIRR